MSESDSTQTNEKILSSHIHYMTEEEVRTLYKEKVKLPNTYFERRRGLPPCPIPKLNWAHNFDFPRIWCILDCKEWVEKYDIRPKRLAYTYDTDFELHFLKPRSEICQDFPYPPYDLHTISSTYTEKLEKEGKNFEPFDFFLFNQTLEHVYHPYLVVSEISKMLCKGGYVFTSVPTVNIPHSTPIHFAHFNPMGLATLFATNGFEVLEIGQWGNLAYIKKLFTSHAWPSYNDLKDGNGNVYNQEKNVCQCWILARKK